MAEPVDGRSTSEDRSPTAIRELNLGLEQRVAWRSINRKLALLAHLALIGDCSSALHRSSAA
jgi:hypothetical protein